MKNGTDSGWQTLKDASKRLKVSVGHLRRLCLDRLQKEGKAQMISGRGVRPFWQIRDDVVHNLRRRGEDPIQISIGDVTITIQSGAPAPSPRPRRS